MPDVINDDRLMDLATLSRGLATGTDSGRNQEDSLDEWLTRVVAVAALFSLTSRHIHRSRFGVRRRHRRIQKRSLEGAKTKGFGRGQISKKYPNF